MPHPTAAQFSYGSATVVFSAFAMLLLSGTESGIGVAAVCAAALALGILVALTVPLPTRAKRTPKLTAPSAAAARTHRTVEDIELATARREHVGEHSLHR
ncbi:hypothetical protein OG206_20435 [Streptomyces sp. NBC_01341]|uniref:hypothetical protein n=1 Tax=Streptomyces sp. NBC_01341 TaxID=2903831 RepID=UPI002E133A5C|nr:hypothetical protein OG206_20435 [Streptomyces sp. NBC_01341]